MKFVIIINCVIMKKWFAFGRGFSTVHSLVSPPLNCAPVLGIVERCDVSDCCVVLYTNLALSMVYHNSESRPVINFFVIVTLL